MRRLCTLAVLLVVSSLSGCASMQAAAGSCGTQMLTGAALGTLGGYGGAAMFGGSRAVRRGAAVAGGVVGTLGGYAMCQRARAQQRDLDARFAALEAELARERAGEAAPVFASSASDERVTPPNGRQPLDRGRDVPGGGYVTTEVVSSGRANMVLVQIGESLVFQPGRDALTPTAERILATVAESVMSQPGMQVEVQGHTDDVGPAQTNLALSQRRADAAADALVAHGLSRLRVVAVGKGEAEPAVEGTSVQARARNRRVEIWLVPLS